MRDASELEKRLLEFHRGMYRRGDCEGSLNYELGKTFSEKSMKVLDSLDKMLDNDYVFSSGCLYMMESYLGDFRRYCDEVSEDFGQLISVDVYMVEWKYDAVLKKFGLKR